MTGTIRLDSSSRIVLSRDLRKAAGILPGRKLRVSATPGRIVLEVEPNRGKILKRGKLKVWAGQVPSTPLEEAVELVRHYGGGIYDSLHATFARSRRARRVVTRNPGHFAHAAPELEVIVP
ncbi:MAG TPA: AbrB/MazE/SpoVT family DNA-binding domain-containing protein [Dongiaceae bacterium]|nr:AbrB/MazE/SpoVT family DNA-binding domain-containing protein [Dongiaceae bacterium]